MSFETGKRMYCSQEGKNEYRRGGSCSEREGQRTHKDVRSGRL